MLLLRDNMRHRVSLVSLGASDGLLGIKKTCCGIQYRRLEMIYKFILNVQQVSLNTDITDRFYIKDDLIVEYNESQTSKSFNQNNITSVRVLHSFSHTDNSMYANVYVGLC